MKKTMRSILTVLLVLVMLFGVIAPTTMAATAGAGQNPPADVVDSYKNSWVEVAYDKDSLYIVLKPDDSNLHFELTQFREIVDIAIDAVYQLVVEGIKDSVTTGAFGEDVKNLKKDDVLDYAFDRYVDENFEGADLTEKYAAFYTAALDGEDNAEMKDFASYMCGMLSLVVKTGVMSKAKLHSSDEARLEIETILDEYGQFADAALYAAKKADFVEILHNEYLLTVADIEADPTISGVEAISYLNTLAFIEEDGTRYDIMTASAGEGVVFSKDGLVDFINGAIPSFETMANTPDNELCWSFGIEMTAKYRDITSPAVGFNLVVAVGGDTEDEFKDNAKAFKQIARDLSEHVTFSIDKDNLIVLHLIAPYRLDRAIAKALSTPYVPDHLKRQYFAIYNTSLSEIRENLKDITVDDIIYELEAIDFEEIFPLIKDYVDYTGYTNEQFIQRIRDHKSKFEWILTLVKDALDMVPEEFSDNTLMQLYNTDGNFGYGGTHDLPLETIFTTVTSKYGPLLASFFGSDFDHVSVDFSVSFLGSRRVRFFLEDGAEAAVSGFLPEGTDLLFFAPKSERRIAYWVDMESGDIVTAMPDKDVDLLAVYSGQDFVWDYTNPFTYDGEAKTPVITNVPDGYVATYVYKDALGNEVNPVDAGTYTATAIFTKDGVVEDLGDAAISFVIGKKAVNLSGASWTDGSLKFNGETQSVTLAGLPEDLPAGAVTYADNSARVPGEYTAIATLNLDPKNYEVEGSIPTSYAWSIALGEIDVSGVVVPSTFTAAYTGSAISIPVSGLETLPSFVSVRVPSKVMAGTYDLEVSFEIGGDDAEYYAPIASIPVQLIITANFTKSFTFSDSYGIVVAVDAETGVPVDYEFVVQDTSYAYGGFNLADGTYGRVISAYDVSFNKDGAVMSVEDNFTVKFRIPESFLENETLQIIYIDPNGTTQQIPATVEDGYMVFEVEHFSTYAIIEITEPPVEVEKGEFPWWILILIAIIIIIAIIILVVLRRKKKDDGEPTPEPTVEPTPEPENEPECEVEPEVEEEPVAEEPVVEEPVVEPTPEPAPAKPIIIRFAEDGEDAEKLGDIDGEVVYVRFRTSFESRYIQAGDEIQGYYTAIKNKLMSYKGVKARTSWNFESFNKTRLQLAKINVKGSALLVYLALDPNNFNAGKYHFTDASDKPKFRDVPLLMKIKSERALKYTLELIEEMMNLYEIPLGKEQNEDYSMPYETTEALASRGLVKIILPAGMILDENSNVVRVNVGDLIDSHNSEAVAEEPVAEPVAEPAPEPAPVVEEPEEEEEVSEADEEAFVAPDEEDDRFNFGVRYNYSMEAKLALSPDTVKSYYAEIASFIKSYGIKISRSWKHERVHKGRKLFALLTFRGTKLVVALALDPATVDAKYHGIDASQYKKYERTPTLLRITSDRKVKQAKELLLKLFLEAGLADKALGIEEPIPQYKSKRQLIDEDLIKVIEGPIPEHEPVADAPVVTEEGYVIEHVVQPIAEEEIVHVDAEHADEILSNEEAEGVIEIIHTGASQRKGKLAIINLDTICDNFEDHEVVNLESLKAKRLVPKNTARIKVLARGVMSKALKIVASKYSLAAVKMIYLAGGIAELED